MYVTKRKLKTCTLSNVAIRYALPLFFLCVRSNVGYIVVAVYIPENEDAGSISEVLQILHKENPEWNPRNMMVDFSLAEISTIEECFPSKKIRMIKYRIDEHEF